VALALILLTVRSYRHRDAANYRYWPTGVIEVISYKGQLEFLSGTPISNWSNRFVSHSVQEWDSRRPWIKKGLLGNRVGTLRRTSVSMPFLAMVFGTLAVILGVTCLPNEDREIRLQFSLRTLLIAATLIALTFGIVLYFYRQ
jgi:hypothetical protein